MYQFYKGTLHHTTNLDREDFARFEHYVAARLRELPDLQVEVQPGLVRFKSTWFRGRRSSLTGSAMAWLGSGSFEFQADRSVMYTFYLHWFFLLVLIPFLMVFIGLSLSRSTAHPALIAIPFLWLVVMLSLNTWFIYKAQKAMFERMEGQFLEIKNVFR